MTDPRLSPEEDAAEPRAALQHHWRSVVEAIAGRLAASQADDSTGLVVARALAQPPLYRLTSETSYALQAEVRRRLQDGLRPIDRIHVLDPWEWLLVLPALRSRAPVTLAILKMQRVLSSPALRLPGSGVELAFAFGGAVFPEMGTDAQYLLQSARIAALSAGDAGSAFEIFHPELERTATATRALESECSAALTNGEFELHLQPQLDFATRRCGHAEALLRWRRGNGEYVPPPEIIAIIERTGLRPHFNRWLFQQAVQTIAALAAAGIEIELAINLTGNDLLDPELPDLAEQTLALWQIDPRHLLLEITETIAVQETRDVALVFERLRQIGFNLSIDDFGTGYAGMSYLQRLPVHEVKIDQSFVCRIENSDKDYEIVASISALAHRLGMAVVAEGVESETVFAALRALGCDRAQGFLFSHALPIEEFKAWWQAHHRA